MSFSKKINLKLAWYKRLTVPQFTLLTGLLIVVIGTFLLSTPICSSKNVGIWESFFTATSAITVTGLTIIDIGPVSYTHLTLPTICSV